MNAKRGPFEVESHSKFARSAFLIFALFLGDGHLVHHPTFPEVHFRPARATLAVPLKKQNPEGTCGSFQPLTYLSSRKEIHMYISATDKTALFIYKVPHI